MFGYVRIVKSEMKVKEYELYSAAYCGLCRAMKKTTGQLSRLVLSYDFVFLSLVRCVLQKEKLTVGMHTCPVHPAKKRPMVEPCPSFEFSARASVLLASYKAEDDAADEKRLKRLLSVSVLPLFKLLRKKVSMSDLESTLCAHLSELEQLEREKCPSLDMTAECFGSLLGEVFSYGLDQKEARIAREIGFHTGKFIYAADAADDYEKDRLDGSYNPLVYMYENGMSEEDKLSVKTALLCELSSLEGAIALVDFSEHRDIERIIYNVIYLGMPEEMQKALFEKKDKYPKGKKVTR